MSIKDAETFQGFLNTRWDRIKDTNDSYILNPDEPVNRLCTEIAGLLISDSIECNIDAELIKTLANAKHTIDSILNASITQNRLCKFNEGKRYNLFLTRTELIILRDKIIVEITNRRDNPVGRVPEGWVIFEEELDKLDSQANVIKRVLGVNNYHAFRLLMPSLEKTTDDDGMLRPESAPFVHDIFSSSTFNFQPEVLRGFIISSDNRRLIDIYSCLEQYENFKHYYDSSLYADPNTLQSEKRYELNDWEIDLLKEKSPNLFRLTNEYVKKYLISADKDQKREYEYKGARSNEANVRYDVFGRFAAYSNKSIKDINAYEFVLLISLACGLGSKDGISLSHPYRWMFADLENERGLELKAGKGILWNIGNMQNIWKNSFTVKQRITISQIECFNQLWRILTDVNYSEYADGSRSTATDCLDGDIDNPEALLLIEKRRKMKGSKSFILPRYYYKWVEGYDNKTGKHNQEVDMTRELPSSYCLNLNKASWYKLAKNNKNILLGLKSETLRKLRNELARAQLSARGVMYDNENAVKAIKLRRPKPKPDELLLNAHKNENVNLLHYIFTQYNDPSLLTKVISFDNSPAGIKTILNVTKQPVRKEYILALIKHNKPNRNTIKFLVKQAAVEKSNITDSTDWSDITEALLNSKLFTKDMMHLLPLPGIRAYLLRSIFTMNINRISSDNFQTIIEVYKQLHNINQTEAALKGILDSVNTSLISKIPTSERWKAREKTDEFSILFSSVILKNLDVTNIKYIIPDSWYQDNLPSELVKLISHASKIEIWKTLKKSPDFKSNIEAIANDKSIFEHWITGWDRNKKKYKHKVLPTLIDVFSSNSQIFLFINEHYKEQNDLSYFICSLFDANPDHKFLHELLLNMSAKDKEIHKNLLFIHVLKTHDNVPKSDLYPGLTVSKNIISLYSTILLMQGVDATKNKKTLMTKLVKYMSGNHDMIAAYFNTLALLFIGNKKLLRNVLYNTEIDPTSPSVDSVNFDAEELMPFLNSCSELYNFSNKNKRGSKLLSMADAVHIFSSKKEHNTLPVLNVLCQSEKCDALCRLGVFSKEKQAEDIQVSYRHKLVHAAQFLVSFLSASNDLGGELITFLIHLLNQYHPKLVAHKVLNNKSSLDKVYALSQADAKTGSSSMNTWFDLLENHEKLAVWLIKKFSVDKLADANIWHHIGECITSNDIKIVQTNINMLVKFSKRFPSALLRAPTKFLLSTIRNRKANDDDINEMMQIDSMLTMINLLCAEHLQGEKRLSMQLADASASLAKYFPPNQQKKLRKVMDVGSKKPTYNLLQVVVDLEELVSIYDMEVVQQLLMKATPEKFSILLHSLRGLSSCDDSKLWNALMNSDILEGNADIDKIKSVTDEKKEVIIKLFSTCNYSEFNKFMLINADEREQLVKWFGDGIDQWNTSKSLTVEQIRSVLNSSRTVGETALVVVKYIVSLAWVADAFLLVKSVLSFRFQENKFVNN